MRALLLGAGLGTRLRPLTDTIPKCLVPIHGKPLLDYWFDLLFNAGIERILLNTHWLHEKVAAHVAASDYRSRVDLIYEPELLGTGGTLKANAAFVEAGPVLVAHADNLTDFDVEGLMRAHNDRPPHCLVTMLAFRTDNPQSCGILELNSENVVTGFYEKVAHPPGNLANAAVYVLEPEILEDLQCIPRPLIDLSTEVLPQLAGRIFAVETAGYHRDIGSATSLALAHQEFRPRVRAG